MEQEDEKESKMEHDDDDKARYEEDWYNFQAETSNSSLNDLNTSANA